MRPLLDGELTPVTIIQAARVCFEQEPDSRSKALLLSTAYSAPRQRAGRAPGDRLDTALADFIPPAPPFSFLQPLSVGFGARSRKTRSKLFL
jgi:hypothetical protein